MESDSPSSELMALLNMAIARELQVSMQYMIQHAVGTGLEPTVSGRDESQGQRKFIASHAPLFLPGPTLKKVAIAEMRHAEAIIERVVVLGGEPPTQPEAITIGITAKEMLENDREQERDAIRLYGQIIGVARKEHDNVTMRLFERILSEEREHHRIFSDLLGLPAALSA